MRYTAALAVGLVIFAGPSRAQTNENLDRCGDEANQSTVFYCTAAINSGNLSNLDLAYSYFNRGNGYTIKGEYDHARKDYDQAIALRPVYPEAFAARGNVYRFQHDTGLAIRDYDQSIKLNPKYDLAFDDRGLTYMDKGDFDHAIRDFDEAIRLNPNNVAAFNNQGMAYRCKGDYEHAIRDFDKAILLRANYGRAFYQRGATRFEQGQFAAAIPDLAESARLLPDQIPSVIWLYLARARAQQQKASDTLTGVQGLNSKAWPDMLFSLYLGTITPKDVLKAVNEPGANIKFEEVCMAHFFLGEYDLLHNLQNDSLEEFRAALAFPCPVSVPTYTTAKVELSRLAH